MTASFKKGFLAAQQDKPVPIIFDKEFTSGWCAFFLQQKPTENDLIAMSVGYQEILLTNSTNDIVRIITPTEARAFSQQLESSAKEAEQKIWRKKK